MKHLLIVGRPGVGKTTLMKHLTQVLRGERIDGFLTEELRDQGTRVGFWLSSLDGRQILLAHRRIEQGARVGPYRVNVEILDQVAVPIIRRSIQHAFVLCLDELGRMELTSSAFQEAVQAALDNGPSIVATAGIHSVPFLSEVKRRKDVELIPLTTANRVTVKEELTARLKALFAEDEAVRQLQGKADFICGMIVSGDVAQIDIEIQQQALREAVNRSFPGQEKLYQLLYESRFRRLWQQFREV